MVERVEASRSVVDAVDDLAARLTAPPREPRAHARYPEQFRALSLAMRFCRFHVADVGIGVEGVALAQMLKKVPDEYLEEIAGEIAVRCRCGTLTPVVDEMTDCYGGCRRWFVGDRSGVWAVRLPDAA